MLLHDRMVTSFGGSHDVKPYRIWRVDIVIVAHVKSQFHGKEGEHRV